MTEEDEDEENGSVKAKAWLIGMSLLAGVVGYALLAGPYESAFEHFSSRRLLIAAGIALGYPMAAAVAVKVDELLRRLANPGEDGEVTLEGKLFLGAFWPLTLLISFVLHSFLAIIHRLFK